MIDIYGHFFSSPSIKVQLCASYLGLPNEYHLVDLTKGEHMTPEFLEINPMGRVPAIVDDGFNLAQSDAICKYLCAISGPSDFYPEEAQEQAMVHQWIDVASQHISQGMSRVFFNRVIASFLGAPVDEASLETGLGMLGRDLPAVNAQLEGKDYLMGDKITLADITMIAALEPAEMASVDLAEYKEIARWRAKVMGRDFYKRVHSHFGAEMQAG